MWTSEFYGGISLLRSTLDLTSDPNGEVTTLAILASSKLFLFSRLGASLCTNYQYHLWANTYDICIYIHYARCTNLQQWCTTYKKYIIWKNVKNKYYLLSLTLQYR